MATGNRDVKLTLGVETTGAAIYVISQSTILSEV